MKEINLKRWEEYKELVLADNFDRLDGPFYRGQADAQWFLETTLDRIRPSLSVNEYYNKLRGINNSLHSCFGVMHDLSKFDKAKELYNEDNINTSSFMAYVRHLGYPSPLLDWTKSPYIAAYFAFEGLQELNRGISHVAIYQYTENAVSYSVCNEIIEPYIHSLGPNIATHKRHFLQQSLYTVCIAGDEKNPYFELHEKATRQPEEQPITKIILPSSERKKVLRELMRMNIHAYSLFVSEESLMKTLATEAFVIQMRDRSSEPDKVPIA